MRDRPQERRNKHDPFARSGHRENSGRIEKRREQDREIPTASRANLTSTINPVYPPLGARDHVPNRELSREHVYEIAKSTDKVIFRQTELAIIRLGNVSFQVRYCPALAAKPEHKDPSVKKTNPFENIHPDLLVHELPRGVPRYNLILNKFPVIPGHFILATKCFRPQTDLLDPEDLEAAFICLNEWPDDKLFAFYNSGEFSGASQAHKHLQFLPVDEMTAGSDQYGWKLLCKQLEGTDPFPSESLPFKAFFKWIPPDPSPSILHDIYTFLHTKAREAASKGPSISYNFAMTTTTMAICPRVSEGSDLWVTGKNLGKIDVNGTILAGSMMVKSLEQWNALREDPRRLVQILVNIGKPMTRTSHQLSEMKNTSKEIDGLIRDVKREIRSP